MGDSRWQKGDVGGSSLLGVLDQTTAALEDAGIPYMFIGGLPLAVYGRPTPIADLDVMVKHEDAEKALRSLDEAGFATKESEQSWLNKGVKDGVLVGPLHRGLQVRASR